MTDQHQAGDDIRVHLTVTPDDGVSADGTTLVTATAYPDGSPPRVLTPAPSGEDRSRWSALLTAAPAGVTRIVWTVTGTGAGVHGFDLVVGPSPVPGDVGRSYATTADLAAWPGAVLSSTSRGALAEASRAIDAALIGARYDTDPDGYPSDPRIRKAFRDAVCAQVAYWDEIGDPTGVGASEQWSTVMVGPVQLSRTGRGQTGGADPNPDIDSPAALRILRTEARLFPIRPAVYG